MRRLALRLLIAACGLAAASLAGPSVAAAAPWCGTSSTEDRPPAVTGHSVRVIYAVPSDGTDRLAELAPRLWTEVEEIDAWWRANDSSRTLNFDLTPYHCGLQVDLTLRRTGVSAGAAQPLESRFALLRDDLLRAPGVDLTHTKYLVYYDGPVDSPNICGQGGGSPSGVGVAFVYLQACARIPTASVAAHELLHALGALAGAVSPNACPTSTAHVCDSTGDLLYPFAQPVALSSFVLDLNRDDYYGHSQAWFDVQDSRWLRRLDATAALALAFEGSGSVRSDVPGVACSASCTTSWNPGSQIMLTATPAAGQRFVEWKGACSGATVNCGLALTADSAVTARFAAARFPLTLLVSGRGRITGAGVACAVSRCARQAVSHRDLRLRAVAAKGWRLKGWSGGCRGSAPTCTVPMTKATSVRATFVRRAKT